MSQGVIIRRKAGQAIPEDYFTLASENCPKVFGIAIVADGKIERNQGESLDLETLRETEKDFNDCDFTVYLGETTSGTNLKDVPPYDMLDNDDDEVVLTMFAEGNFPGFVKEKASHPAEYYLAEFASDKISDIFDAVDKDLDKLMTKLGADRFKEQLKMNAVSRGFITFVAQNGKSLTIAQGDTAKEFPWGWVSNTFGYGEKKEAAPVEEPKKKSLFSRNKSTVREKHVPDDVAAAGAAKAPPTATALPKDAKTGSNNISQPAKPKPVILAIDNIKVKKMKAPQSFNRRAKKAWFKERLGHIPPTWNNIDAEYEVYIGPMGQILTKAEIKAALGMSAASLPELKNPKAGKQDDIEADNIDLDRPVPNPLPMMSKNGRDRMHRMISDERIKKLIAENAAVVEDPERAQNREAKIPRMFMQLGMKDVADFDKLPSVEWERMGRNDIHDLACWTWDYRTRALMAEAKLASLTQKQPSATKDVEEPVAQPKKRSLFSRQNAA